MTATFHVGDAIEVCYCGAPIKEVGNWWVHVSSNSRWCYEEESGLDEESRCDACPDPKGWWV